MTRRARAGPQQISRSLPSFPPLSRLADWSIGALDDSHGRRYVNSWTTLRLAPGSPRPLGGTGVFYVHS